MRKKSYVQEGGREREGGVERNKQDKLKKKDKQEEDRLETRRAKTAYLFRTKIR